MFNRLSIKGTLLLLGTLTVGTILIASTITFMRVSALQSESLYVDAGEQLHTHLLEAQLATLSIWQRFSDISATRKSADLDAVLADTQRSADKLRAAYKGVLSSTYRTDLSDLKTLQKEFDSLYTLGQRMVRLYINEGTTAGNPLMEEYERRSQALLQRLQTVQQRLGAEIYAEEAQNRQPLEQGKWMALVAGVAVVVVFTLLLLMVMRKITVNLTNIQQTLQRAAQGDTSVRFRT